MKVKPAVLWALLFAPWLVALSVTYVLLLALNIGVAGQDRIRSIRKS